MATLSRLTGIRSSGSIVIPGSTVPLYQEDEFCVVEFAMLMTQWLADLHRHAIDFSYSSMESDETGLITLSKEHHGWRVAALHQNYVEGRLFSLEEIADAVSAFVTRLRAQVRERFDHDIAHLVSGGRIAL